MSLDGVVSIARILDRDYTLKAKAVEVDTDLLVFDAYLTGYEAMPLDLCFGSRIPPISDISGHQAQFLQEHFTYKRIKLPEDVTMQLESRDFDINRLVFRKSDSDDKRVAEKRPYLFEIIDQRFGRQITIRAQSMLILRY